MLSKEKNETVLWSSNVELTFFIYLHTCNFPFNFFFQCVKFPSLCSFQSFATFKMNKPTIFDYHGILKNMFEKNLGCEFPKFYRKEVKCLDKSFQRLIKGFFFWCTPFLQYALLYDLQYDLQYVQEIIAYNSIYTYTKTMQLYKIQSTGGNI